MKQKECIFGKINKINKSLVRLAKEKREKTQTANVRNVAGAIDTGPMDIKRKIRKYHPEFFPATLNQFLEKHKLLQLIQWEATNQQRN